MRQTACKGGCRSSLDCRGNMLRFNSPVRMMESGFPLPAFARACFGGMTLGAPLTPTPQFGLLVGLGQRTNDERSLVIPDLIGIQGRFANRPYASIRVVRSPFSRCPEPVEGRILDFVARLWFDKLTTNGSGGSGGAPLACISQVPGRSIRVKWRRAANTGYVK